MTGAKTSKNSHSIRVKKDLDMDEHPSQSHEVTLEIDDNADVAVYEKKKKKRNRRH